MTFSAYLHSSLEGVFSNSLFIGLVLGLLVQDIRNSKYLSWERKIKGDGIEKDMLRGLFYLASYVVAVPIGIMALVIIIFFLWVISLLGV